MTELLKPTDGKCAKCGSPDMLLAEDFTRYSTCEVEDGKWVASAGNDEPSAADDAVRFFCPGCGAGHEVPEEL